MVAYENRDLAAACIPTILIIVVGTLACPHLFGFAVNSNEESVFGFFLGTFTVLLFLSWLSEKAGEPCSEILEKH